MKPESQIVVGIFNNSHVIIGVQMSATYHHFSEILGYKSTYFNLTKI